MQECRVSQITLSPCDPLAQTLSHELEGICGNIDGR